LLLYFYRLFEDEDRARAVCRVIHFENFSGGSIPMTPFNKFIRGLSVTHDVINKFAKVWPIIFETFGGLTLKHVKVSSFLKLL
jgi:hypothetical protein